MINKYDPYDFVDTFTKHTVHLTYLFGDVKVVVEYTVISDGYGLDIIGGYAIDDDGLWVQDSFKLVEGKLVYDSEYDIVKVRSGKRLIEVETWELKNYLVGIEIVNVEAIKNDNI